mgnify:CR=1 FL=1
MAGGHIVFDIETEPKGLDELKAIHGPFDPVSKLGPMPGEFDPSSVKLGNLKDQAKIAEKIEAARVAHVERAANYNRDLADCEQSYWASVVQNAALCATTGRVVAIGYKSATKSTLLTVDECSETQLVSHFWTQFSALRKAGRRMIGFYSNSFDVPFLARRAWMLGVPVPNEALTPTGWLDSTFVDLMARWQFGNKRDSIKLGEACRALGIGDKPQGEDAVTGATFYEHFRSGDAEKKAKALYYLANDLDMTWGMAERLGVL